MISQKLLCTGLLLLASIGAPLGAKGALSYAGDKLYASTTGEVIATFLGSDAGYTDLLFLDPFTGSLNVIFNNQTTAPGTTRSLGFFTAGTELVFRLDVTNTGDSFYSGPASRNADNVVHAAVDSAYPGGVFVGFEDLYGGGDLDYNDIMYKFAGVTTNNPGVPAAPEPASVAMWAAMLLGGAGIAAMRRSRQRIA